MFIISNFILFKHFYPFKNNINVFNLSFKKLLNEFCEIDYFIIFLLEKGFLMKLQKRESILNEIKPVNI